MIGSAPRIAASKVAVPEVTTESFEIDKKSLDQIISIMIGRSSK